jgi:hypothetical protein
MLGVAGIALALLAAAASSSRHQPVAELEERRAIREHAARLLAAENFDELERIARDYRETGARTGSGIWKLTVLYGGIHDAVLLEPGDEDGWSRLAARLKRWEQSHPLSPTPVIAQVIALKRYAWGLRPRSLLIEASTGSSTRFLTALEAARRLLAEKSGIAGADPHYYVLYAQLAHALGEDSGRFLEAVEEGIRRAPGYYQLYFAALDHFAHDEARRARDLEAFANMAVARSRASEGLAVYARLYWYAADVYFDNELPESLAIDWNKMRAGIADVIARYPDPWNLNHFARFACAAGEIDTLKMLMQSIDQPIAQAWSSMRQYERCRNLVERSVAH